MFAALPTALAPGLAFATWSVVAVDPATREVGVGAATCTVGVELVRGVVPGRGVVAAQANTNLRARKAAVAALERGASPEEVLAEAEAISGGWLGSAWADQQFAVATLEAGPAEPLALSAEPQALAHTGADTIAWAGSVSAPGVSVQGNILRGPEVVEAALAAFLSGEQAHGREPDLAERILRALEAGGAAGGDERCPVERPALTAFMLVASPDDPPDAPSLYLVAPRAFGMSGAVWNMLFPYQPDPDEPLPVESLRRLLNANRARELR